MRRPTYVRMPGPARDPRVVAVEARGRNIAIELRAGHNLLSELRRGFGAQGFVGGVANIGPVALAPFSYVMPALSKTGENAAFYSDTFRPPGTTRLESGAVTIGERDRAPFYHCHALWCEADGTRTGGHILPEETSVAESACIEALAIDGACFLAAPDSETNFKLFAPTHRGPSAALTDRRVLALRLKPNQDFLTALEVTAAAHGIQRARIRGGVGSIIGAAFADGTIVGNFATEIYVRSGEIVLNADGRPQASADIALVDYTGALAAGRLVKGINPILMTFELALEILD